MVGGFVVVGARRIFSLIWIPFRTRATNAGWKAQHLENVTSLELRAFISRRPQHFHNLGVNLPDWRFCNNRFSETILRIRVGTNHRIADKFSILMTAQYTGVASIPSYLTMLSQHSRTTARK